MQLTATEDLAAPRERVYAALTDFDLLETRILARGARVTRTAEPAGDPVGTAWTAEFHFRDRDRQAEIVLAEAIRPERLVFDGVTGGLQTRTVLDLLEVEPARTRVVVSSELKARTLAAKLIVQSLNLGKAGVERRFRARVADYAGQLQDRLDGPA